MYFRQRLWRYRWVKRVEFAEVLCRIDPRRRAIDVGANIGLFTALLAARCSHVYAYEPDPESFAMLSRMAPNNCTLYRVGLSDRAGVATLVTPVIDGVAHGGRSSLAVSFDDGARAEREIELATLDSRDHRDVGFIKIDIEGHESAMLAGAVATLRRERPVVWIEVEQRHRDAPVAEVFEFFARLGYRGLFPWAGHLERVERFDPALHQPANPSIPAARDFLFEPT